MTNRPKLAVSGAVRIAFAGSRGRTMARNSRNANAVPAASAMTPAATVTAHSALSPPTIPMMKEARVSENRSRKASRFWNWAARHDAPMSIA